MIVSRVRTPSTLGQMAAGLGLAYAHETGRTLGPRLGAIALGILAVEHRGGAAIFNHNWGNLTATDADPSPKYENPAWEPGAVGMPRWFLAFDSHAEGARTWWRWMLAKWPHVLEAGELGDADRAATLLRTEGYGWTDEGPAALRVWLPQTTALFGRPNRIGPGRRPAYLGLSVTAFALSVGPFLARAMGYNAANGFAIGGAVSALAIGIDLARAP